MDRGKNSGVGDEGVPPEAELRGRLGAVQAAQSQVNNDTGGAFAIPGDREAAAARDPCEEGVPLAGGEEGDLLRYFPAARIGDDQGAHPVVIETVRR